MHDKGSGLRRVALLRVRRAAVGMGWAAAIAAPFVTHAALVTGQFRLLAAGFAACQLAMLGMVALGQTRGWRRTAGWLAMALLLLLLGARVVQPAMLGVTGLLTASGVSHAVIYLSLLALFGGTLRPGRTPLITALATRVRGGLTPAMLRYTRKVTEAWCMFFAAQLVASVVLLAVAPATVWSMFINVLDAPLVALMFAAEYGVRRLRFPHYNHISPLETARHFRRAEAPHG